MRFWKKIFPFLLVLTWGTPVLAVLIITENFSPTQSSPWGNERGSWVAANGLYSAQYPSNSPLTYTSLPIPLTDFVFECDIIGVSDGGIWLRSNFRNGKASGVLLITGGYGRSGTGLYWHIVHNDNVSPILNPVGRLFSQKQNIHLRVEVKGNTYSAFLNGSRTAATSLTSGEFSSGYVGLYDFSGQKFANIRIETIHTMASAPTGRDYTYDRPRGNLLETMVVPNDKPVKIFSKTFLEKGRWYVIEASGVISDWSHVKEGVDAVWCYAEWRCGKQGEVWNQLRIDGKGMTEIVGQTIPYHPQHVYQVRFQGQGRPVELYCIDAQSSWSDNSGAFTVKIYE